MKILILGVNGFIGSNLSEKILKTTGWEIFGIDLQNDKLEKCLGHENFHFTQGDILQNKNWVNEHIQQCDVILPLVAIATPASYVKDPLRIFELDFEANVDVIRQCVQYKKRIIFPSTSEVYGMCTDAEFDEETSHLVTGPIHKERWIYSASKQLLDRVIYAYGVHHGLAYTLFRPFNWYGPRQDNILNSNPGSSRVLAQFIGNILRGEAVALVDGGKQQRSFTYIEDGIDALVKIIANENNAAHNQIFNIGNPKENISVRQLAETLVQLLKQYPQYNDAASKATLLDVPAEKYYGAGYQDVALRVPAIQRAKEKLGWMPKVNLEDGLKKTLDFYLA